LLGMLNMREGRVLLNDRTFQTCLHNKE